MKNLTSTLFYADEFTNIYPYDSFSTNTYGLEAFNSFYI